MDTSTLAAPDAVLDDLPTLLSEFVELLNVKEQDRRREVNGRHLAQYGRLLYPEGGQYATFSLDAPGRKYQRIVMSTDGQRSVHAFVDRKTGDVLKPAGWKAPAAGARYNLLDGESRALLHERCDFAGGYLYAWACGA